MYSYFLGCYFPKSLSIYIQAPHLPAIISISRLGPTSSLSLVNIWPLLSASWLPTAKATTHPQDHTPHRCSFCGFQFLPFNYHLHPSRRFGSASYSIIATASHHSQFKTTGCHLANSLIHWLMQMELLWKVKACRADPQMRKTLVSSYHTLPNTQSKEHGTYQS